MSQIDWVGGESGKQFEPKAKNLLVSFSGGRTSAYMGYLIKTKYQQFYENVVFIFANTGLENEKTLSFVKACDQNFQFNSVWLEAYVIHGQKISTKHKVVSFESASRNGEPFEEVIKKYGIPNQQSPHCTRETKLNPINSYVSDVLGWKNGDYETAIGIRTDEMRRVKDPWPRLICYPLVDWDPSDKQDVLDWWEDQSFDLGLQEHQGNCKTCWKKSFAKLIKIHSEDPRSFDFFEKMENKYGRVGPEFAKYDAPNRVFFRQRISVDALRNMANGSNLNQATLNLYSNGGCSESCELFQTE